MTTAPQPLRDSREQPAAGRLPPHDAGAEAAVLAALLLSPDSLALVQPRLRAQDFFYDHNRWCYEAATALGDRGEPITPTTLAHELERVGRLDAVGGEPYLAGLLARFPTVLAVEAHAGIIQRDATYRRLVSAGAEIAQLAYRGGPDLDRGLAEAEALLLAVGERREYDGTTTAQAIRRRFIDDGGAEPDVVRSGFLELDALIGGFRPQSLTIVGARTGVGKSALLLDLARKAARDQGLAVALFSNELSTDEILTRLLARDARVPARRLAPGRHDQHAEDRIILAAGRIAEDAITIFDEASATVPEIRAHCRRLQVHDRLDLVLVDYLQLLRGVTPGRESRAYELAEITRSLKELARDLRVPVVAAAQLNREVEARPSRLPRLSDLRESGAIEQDADVVLLLHRPDDPSPDGEGGGPAPEGATERIQLFVAKNRHGPRGALALRFDESLVSFRDWVERDPEGEEHWWSS